MPRDIVNEGGAGCESPAWYVRGLGYQRWACFIVRAEWLPVGPRELLADVAAKYLGLTRIVEGGHTSSMLAMDDGQPAFRGRYSKVMAERLHGISDFVATASAVYASAAELFQERARMQ